MRTFGWALAALLPAAIGCTGAEARPAAQLPAGMLGFVCDTKERSQAIALDTLREASASPAAFDADLAAGKLAVERADKLRADVLSGKSAEPPYQMPGRFATLALAAPSARIAELFRRTARDQFSRLHLAAATQRVSWAAGLSDNARAYAYQLIALDWCGVDEANTAWIKAEIARDGWFTIGGFGEDANKAALLLVQHADRDPAFQADVLKLLEPLVATGQTTAKTYAYLYDRVAVAQKRPQRFGTQGRCTGPGKWQAREVEGPAELDARRASAGLPPEAEYEAGLSKGCERADPSPG